MWWPEEENWYGGVVRSKDGSKGYVGVYEHGSRSVSLMSAV